MEEKTVSIRGRNVLAAIPTIDGKVDVRIAARLTEAAVTLARAGANLGISWQSHCSSISRARNSIAADFIGLGEEWTDLFFIDADTVFRSDDLVRLVVRATEYDVICGGVPTKRRVDEKGEVIRTYKMDYVGEGAQNPDGLIQMKRIGTAFMNIRRHVLTGIIDRGVETYFVPDLNKTHWAFFREDIEDGHYWGEDYYFCNRLQKDGVGLWLDPYCKFSHAKNYDINGCVADDFTMPSELQEEAG